MYQGYIYSSVILSEFELLYSVILLLQDKFVPICFLCTFFWYITFMYVIEPTVLLLFKELIFKSNKTKKENKYAIIVYYAIILYFTIIYTVTLTDALSFFMWIQFFLWCYSLSDWRNSFSISCKTDLLSMHFLSF